MISTIDSTFLFTSALGLKDPWKVDEIRFEPEQGEIHFDLACDAKRLGCTAHLAASLLFPVQSLSARTFNHGEVRPMG